MAIQRAPILNIHSFFAAFATGILVMIGTLPLLPFNKISSFGWTLFWVLPLAVVAYLIGYLFHFISLWICGKTTVLDHRAYFEKELRKKEHLSTEVVTKFYDIVHEKLNTDFRGQPAGQRKQLYSYVLSINKLVGAPMSNYLQALYSFFRNVTLMSVFLVIVYTSIFILELFGSLTGTPLYITGFEKPIHLIMGLIFIFILIGGLSFNIQQKYMIYYIEYLISDFVNSHDNNIGTEQQ